MESTTETIEIPSEPPESHFLLDAQDLHVQMSGHHVLKRINLKIPRGETLALIGESGCGKTVLMKTLIGLIRPSRGIVRFDGQNIATMNPTQTVEFRKKIGFVFQNAALFDSMTVGQNVAFPLRQHGAVEADEVEPLVLQALADVGLPDDIVRRRPAQLSGGMRKRVGIARALILQPDLVLYDEPTTGLDPIVSDVINELMLGVRRKYPVTSIIVTHDMNTARKVADRVIMLYPRRRLQDNESQVLFDGPPTSLENFEDRRVRQFVRGEAGERLMEMRQRSDALRESLIEDSDDDSETTPIE
ncbi:putative phospholipid import ATP-binding protein MlaF [Rosistilla carotiformis]|uniref:Putative phospholipid import ATP-binding protein MlaF n=1 Tax=Rosistilla carotiformis TaxID=2528017 RepID=A0A518JTA5_9BACT|nr:ATP-binding cassette domain-containing protein [Rosistilla carotiformis]QDV68777.1 putative phospholipid import ATP-binding protein MlaF [Rosistilla carotiformis]